MLTQRRVAVVVGPACLGATDLTRFGADQWRDAIASTVEIVPLDLSTPEGLADLWTCHGVVMISDGAYGEAGDARTLTTIVEWTRRGGVLATVGPSPFLVAETDGVIGSAIAHAIDISETLIGYTACEARLLVTPAGRRLLDEDAIPGTLVGLNAGGARSLVLHPLSHPVESLVETDRGDTVLGTHALGQGWWITWSAGALTPIAGTLIGAVGRLVDELLPPDPPGRPRILISQVSTDDHGDDIVSVWHDDVTSSFTLADQDNPRMTWPAEQDSRGRARFRIPSQEEPRSLGVSAEPGPPIEYRIVYPPARRPAGRATPPPQPSGFEDFWRDRLSELGPPVASLAIAPFPDASTATIEAFRVEYDGWMGARISGVLSRPRVGSHAALLSLPGYAVGGLESHPWHLADAFAILSIDVRTIGSSTEVPIESEGLLTYGLHDPPQSGMVGAVLDAVRAFDVLVPLSEPGMPVGVIGASQGGALALAVGALRPAEAVASLSPFLLDIRRAYLTVSSEPYRELQRYAEIDPRHRREALAALDVVDAAHFLPRQTRPCLVIYSPEDDIAPAAGIENWYPDLANLDVRARAGGHIAPATVAVRNEVRTWMREQLRADSVRPE